MKRMIWYMVLVFAGMQTRAQDTTVTLEFEMVMAAWKGDSAYTIRLLKEGADVNSVSYDGISALMYAVQEGHLAVVKILAANGANLNYTYSGLLPALTSAVAKDRFEIARYLLHKGANPNLGDDKENTPLLYAAAYGNLRMLKLLLAYKADPSMKNYSGESPLWYAAYNGDRMAAYELLLAGADINIKDKLGNTPLMIASMYNDTAMINYLLLNKADMSQTSNREMDALDYAVLHSRWEAFKTLSVYRKPDQKEIRLLKKSAIANGNYPLLDSVKTISKSPWLLPYIASMSLSYESVFTWNDMMFSPFLIWHENRYRLAFRMGWSARYWRNRVDFIYKENTYQFWERRNDFYAGIEKKIRINPTESINHSALYAGIQANYSVIRYRGMAYRPEPGFTFSPYVGYALTGRFGGYGIRYLYYPTGDTGLSPHRLGLYFTITLYNRNPVKNLVKCSLCD